MGVKLVIDNNGKAMAHKFGQTILLIVSTVLIVFSIIRWGSELKILLVNIALALVGAFLAIQLMIYAYRQLDKLTPFDTAEQLKAGNQAVGMVVAGLFIGIGIVIGLIMALCVS